MPTYQINFSLSSDFPPNARAVKIEIPRPVTRPTTPLEDALLALPNIPDSQADRLNVFGGIIDHQPTESDLLLMVAAEHARRKSRADEVRLEKDAKTRRNEYIAAWAAEHGSERLRGQIALGLSGWPQYLHERLAFDFDDSLYYNVELDNGGNHEEIINPSMDLVDRGKLLRDRLVELGITSSDIAFYEIALPDDPHNCGAQQYVCFTYRPGPEELFDEKWIRSRF